ncbi:hypothetical protein HMI54_012795 [Coelomomyces lativittatus]|nr:hypothetical protein HMI54_012795 [Coelomomyces lativittatus]
MTFNSFGKFKTRISMKTKKFYTVFREALKENPFAFCFGMQRPFPSKTSTPSTFIMVRKSTLDAKFLSILEEDKEIHFKLQSTKVKREKLIPFNVSKLQSLKARSESHAALINKCGSQIEKMTQ